MNIFKRVFTSVSASMDDVVNKVENHDAIVESMIKQSRQAAANTRVRLARVQSDGKLLDSQLVKLQQQSKAWQSRAIESAATDENKALHCLKRKKQIDLDLERLENTITEHKVSEQKLRTSLQTIETRLDEVNLKRNSLRSRQSVAEAMRIIEKVDAECCDSLVSTFDRWEGVLVESEMTQQYLPNDHFHVDPVEQEFIEREEAERLKSELDELLSSKSGDCHE